MAADESFGLRPIFLGVASSWHFCANAVEVYFDNVVYFLSTKGTNWQYRFEGLTVADSTFWSSLS